MTQESELVDAGTAFIMKHGLNANREIVRIACLSFYGGAAHERAADEIATRHWANQTHHLILKNDELVRLAAWMLHAGSFNADDTSRIREHLDTLKAVVPSPAVEQPLAMQILRWYEKAVQTQSPDTATVRTVRHFLGLPLLTPEEAEVESRRAQQIPAPQQGDQK